MNEPVLVILAAGLGSRYGGLKQVDVVSDNGETIIDFSLFDAYRAGFKKVVLIIKKEHVSIFDEHVGSRIRPYMDVVYAYQDVNDLPEGFNCPQGRTKPWGTTHALLCTEPYITGPFMVINADDFYGRESFEKMYKFLSEEVKGTDFGMVGYQLTKTLTDNGSVTRGLCQCENGYLTGIVETQKIKKGPNGAVSVLEDGSEVEIGEGIASMNYWGFTPDIYPLLKELFVEFLKERGNELKSEHVIPTAVGSLINAGKASVKVMTTSAEWFGVTYPQDKEMVTRKIANLKMNGAYPFKLWD